MAQFEQFSVEGEIAGLGVLARKGWLAQQPRDFQARVARLGRWREARAGEQLYLAGDEAEWIVGLGHGIMEITLPLLGDEPVVVHRAEPGSWTGEASVIAGQTRFISVAAATDMRVFVLPATGMRRILEAEPQHWRSFYELSLSTSRILVTLLAETLSLSPRARVARILLRLARPDGSVPGSQEDLARLLGMTRSSLRRALSSLIEIGTIQIGYGIVVIRDREKLEKLTSEA